MQRLEGPRRSRGTHVEGARGGMMRRRLEGPTRCPRCPCGGRLGGVMRGRSDLDDERARGSVGAAHEVYSCGAWVVRDPRVQRDAGWLLLDRGYALEDALTLIELNLVGD